MDLPQAFDTFQADLPGSPRGERRRRDVAALEVLREYLIEYAALEQTTQITPTELSDLLARWFLASEEADISLAMQLLETTTAFATWLVAHAEAPELAAWPGVAERLRTDLPRVLEATQALAEEVARDTLGAEVEASQEEDAEEVGTFSTGLDRIVRPGEVDYAQAEQDYFTLERITREGLFLQSPLGAQAGEAARGPVLVPAAAAGLLRPGDILNVEIAPAGAAWEILNVGRVHPGGYGWSP